ncbi:Uncharacterized protein APZ42_019704 [Daphnia magna]|uniref:Uncharacterized protein n=1 Tax=Daphnia magna TaxID=35525 RepID=A0A164Y4I0_9CRUS|nr:Uncharacterized protein APZ42_019704 [Daphnia magna]
MDFHFLISTTGKAPSNSGWNFLPADNNRQHGSHTLGHNTLNSQKKEFWLLSYSLGLGFNLLLSAHFQVYLIVLRAV